ncbi:hypothetical protein HW555_009432 [Spodoptera exigua]|uniref:Uncharacterized protein n=1 Tax=Spodoptera exigua TaxID=7107 RepID=A0A835GAM4_SPOEX|nr:hypothetical protein HW555_009432 [Spodoptera exigua]
MMVNFSLYLDENLIRDNNKAGSLDDNHLPECDINLHKMFRANSTRLCRHPVSSTCHVNPLFSGINIFHVKLILEHNQFSEVVII